MAARLQRDVKIGSGCILGAVREGVALGVKAADVLVPAVSMMRPSLTMTQPTMGLGST